MQLKLTMKIPLVLVIALVMFQHANSISLTQELNELEDALLERELEEFERELVDIFSDKEVVADGYDIELKGDLYYEVTIGSNLAKFISDNDLVQVTISPEEFITYIKEISAEISKRVDQERREFLREKYYSLFRGIVADFSAWQFYFEISAGSGAVVMVSKKDGSYFAWILKDTVNKE